MEMLVTKFSKGKYRNEGDLFAEPISAQNVKLMGEMIALQALRTVKQYDMKIADILAFHPKAIFPERSKNTQEVCRTNTANGIINNYFILLDCYHFQLTCIQLHII